MAEPSSVPVMEKDVSFIGKACCIYTRCPLRRASSETQLLDDCVISTRYKQNSFVTALVPREAGLGQCSVSLPSVEADLHPYGFSVIQPRSVCSLGSLGYLHRVSLHPVSSKPSTSSVRTSLCFYKDAGVSDELL